MKKIILFFIISSIQLFSVTMDDLFQKYSNNKDVSFEIKLHTGDELKQCYIINNFNNNSNVIAVERKNLLIIIFKQGIANVTLVDKPYSALVNGDRIAGEISDRANTKIVESSVFGKIKVKDRLIKNLVKTFNPFTNETFPTDSFVHNGNYGIETKHLDGLKEFKNLTLLKINGEGEELDFHKLYNFSKLKSLKINNLKITNNIDLNKFDKIEKISIRDSTIEKDLVFENMEFLSEINLRNNNLKISKIKNLFSLKNLILRNNNLEKLPEMSKLEPLHHVDLGRNKLSNIDGLAKIEYIFGLRLDYNKFTNLDGIERFRDLGGLDISNNKLTSLKNIDKLKHLINLNISNNKFTSLKNIDKLKGLHVLNISNNKLTSLKNIDKLKHLRTLNIESNPIENIDVLKKIEFLEYLNINHTKVTDISPIKDVFDISIVGLKLKDTDLSDFGFSYMNFDCALIKKFPENSQEVKFYISDNSQVEYIKKFKNIINLIDFSLYKGDWTCVKDLPRFFEWDFYKTDFADLSLLENKKDSVGVLRLDESKVKDFSFLKELSVLEKVVVSLPLEDFKELKKKFPKIDMFNIYKKKNNTKKNDLN